MTKGALMVVAMLAVVGLAIAAGPGAVGFVRAHQDAWRAFAARHLVMAALAFVLAYGLAVTAMLPVALVLTVASGVIFGALTGALLSILGALAGALAAYFLAQRLGADWTARTRSIDLLPAGGSGRNAFAIIVTLRLTPLVPFTPVSVAAAAVRMPLLSFALATCLGVTPESVIYAAAWAGVAHIVGGAA